MFLKFRDLKTGRVEWRFNGHFDGQLGYLTGDDRCGTNWDIKGDGTEIWLKMAIISTNPTFYALLHQLSQTFYSIFCFIMSCKDP